MKRPSLIWCLSYDATAVFSMNWHKPGINAILICISFTLQGCWLYIWRATEYFTIISGEFSPPLVLVEKPSMSIVSQNFQKTKSLNRLFHQLESFDDTWTCTFVVNTNCLWTDSSCVINFIVVSPWFQAMNIKSVGSENDEEKIYQVNYMIWYHMSSWKLHDIITICFQKSNYFHLL